MECLAGTGLAGTDRCFLGGNPNDANCNKFISEDEFIEKLNKKSSAHSPPSEEAT